MAFGGDPGALPRASLLGAVGALFTHDAVTAVTGGPCAICIARGTCAALANCFALATCLDRATRDARATCDALASCVARTYCVPRATCIARTAATGITRCNCCATLRCAHDYRCSHDGRSSHRWLDDRTCDALTGAGRIREATTARALPASSAPTSSPAPAGCRVRLTRRSPCSSP